MLDKKSSFIMSVAEKKRNNQLTSINEEGGAGKTIDNSKTAALILSIGLLIHNIFEGLSIGLSKDQNALIIMMIAVCSHKLITAFSLGLSFHTAGWWDCSSITVMSVFTVAGPIGTLVGFILASDAPEVLAAIFMSITTGTFL